MLSSAPRVGVHVGKLMLCTSLLALFIPRGGLFLSTVCKLWAEIAEEDFAKRCGSSGWNLPRRPRGLAAQTSRPWRHLFLSRSCKGCHGVGVRTSTSTYSTLYAGVWTPVECAYQLKGAARAGELDSTVKCLGYQERRIAV